MINIILHLLVLAVVLAVADIIKDKIVAVVKVIRDKL